MNRLLFLVAIALSAISILGCVNPKSSELSSQKSSELLSNVHEDDSKTEIKEDTCSTPIDSIIINLTIPKYGFRNICFFIDPHNLDKCVVFMKNSPKAMRISHSTCNYIMSVVSQIYITKEISIIESKAKKDTKVISDFPHLSFQIFLKKHHIYEDLYVGKRQNYYEIQYSTQFYDLYRELYNLASEFYANP
jgi:hypothetical protein